jgi:MFS family permease
MSAPDRSPRASTAAPPHGVAAAECALALGGFALGTGEFASMGLLPNVARDIAVSAPVAGHMISAYALGVVIGAPVIAAAFARAPRRAMLIGLMLVFALGNIAPPPAVMGRSSPHAFLPACRTALISASHPWSRRRWWRRTNGRRRSGG